MMFILIWFGLALVTFIHVIYHDSEFDDITLGDFVLMLFICMVGGPIVFFVVLLTVFNSTVVFKMRKKR